MTVLNNVNMEALERTAADPALVRRKQQASGEWLLETGGPQFRAEVIFEGGKVVMESDQPSFLEGGGTRPGPLHYCFFGLASCYTATFATVAAQMGLTLKKLSARLEADLDFSRVFGLSQNPIMEEVRITLSVESDAPKDKLEEVERLAYERCPAVFALTSQVRLKPALELG
jgi:uncharacterized OsmC-like protein